MIEVDGTAIPLDPGKTYLIVIKDGEVPRHVEHGLVQRLSDLGIRGHLIRVRTNVNNIRLVQIDSAEGPVKVQGDAEVVK